ncbi:MAG: tetratricopeptide repeat protein [Polaromonas sp.]|uniref:tetratricopeptide repeat protein n=1 Tax=Polaromonas sp. TaxID=1869339 RepID=UPI0027340184|nr:tetratricopeptide repeat protein [Polaromonas sp.]MDP2816818.1 tetratricopeptide repeat protein [Polaromonas sp.]
MNPAAASDTASRLAQALGLHQEGKLAEAAAGYSEVLASNPAQADALHLLGVIELQTNKPVQAMDWINRAIASDGRHPVFHNNLGIALESMNRLEDAAASYGQALTLNAAFAEAHYNRGNVLDKLIQPLAALASLDVAIQCRPVYVEAHFARGSVLRKLGQGEAAVESYGRALAIKPDYAEAYFNRAIALRSLNRTQDAVDDYRRAIQFRPDFPTAYNNCGNALKKLAQFPAALEAFDQAIRLDPSFADAYNNRGNVLRALKNIPAAIESFRKVIGLDPAYPEAYNNLGNALMEQRKVQQAIDNYDQAIALKADYAKPYSNRGNALRDIGRLDAAMARYEQALALKPDYADAQWNHSLCLLLAGDFVQGWKKYEWRWQNAVLQRAARGFTQPLWLGEQPLAGKTILLHAEQGLGDTLQFCRYVPLVRDLGARVILEVQAPLQHLLAGLDGAASVVVKGRPLPAFDLHCPLLSLPLAFGTVPDDVPAGMPYLAASPAKKEQWQRRLGSPVGMRVGLVWSGNADHTNDRNRSISLAELVGHVPAGVEYISLQKEVRVEDSATLAANPQIRCFDQEIEDFTDTAALCELVDVVISVDTSVAHLAGALGRPVWIALPFNPDWRWMLERDDSPWYPSARLYRQQTAGDWHGVARRIAADLAARLR